MPMEREDEAVAFGLRIRRRRDALALTQMQVAVRAGCSLQQVSLLELGKVRMPGLRTMSTLAAALECRAVDLWPELLGAPGGTASGAGTGEAAAPELG